MTAKTNKNQQLPSKKDREAALRKLAQEARERATAYRNGTFGQEETTKSGRDKPGDEEVRTLEEWSDIVGQRIEDAMRRGVFDDLPGRGKPLDMSRDPFIPEDQQMANKLLQNNNLTPEWIGDRKAVLSAIQQLRTHMRDVATTYQAEWARATAQNGSANLASTAFPMLQPAEHAGQPMPGETRPGPEKSSPTIRSAAKIRSAEQLAEEWSRQIVYWENRLVELNKRILSLNLKQPVTHLEIFQLRLDEELARAGATRELG